MDSTPPAVPNHHAHYRGFAGVPGLIAAATMLAGRERYARLAVQLRGLAASDGVADIGCGPGSAVRHAGRLGAAATGVARLVTREADRVRFAHGSAESIPLPDASVTVLWSISCVHHWADIGKGLAESRRVLSPGGRLAVIERRSVPNARGLASHGWTEDQAAAFAARCAASGFEDPRVSEHRIGRRAVLSVTATNPGTAHERRG
jgi:ubiquinone/menaquinone biosynthesis C-methylase UbiE